MKNKSTIIGASLGGSALLAILVTALFFWLGPNLQIRRVVALQEQLVNAEDMSRVEKNSLKTQLMRAIDEMDRENRRKLQELVRDQQRQLTATNMKAFQAASETEKIAVLDEAIDHWVKTREVNSAMRSGRGWRGGRGRRGGGDREARGRRPENTGQPRGERPVSGETVRRDRRRERDGDNERPELTEEEQSLRAEYFTALQQRAEHRGIEMRGQRRGRNWR